MPIRDDVPSLVKFLNSLLAVDREAIEKLVAARVPCNEELAAHPLVQVMATADGPCVGILGILNGYAGVYDDGPYAGYGPISAIFDDGRLSRFAIIPSD